MNNTGNVRLDQFQLLEHAVTCTSPADVLGTGATQRCKVRAGPVDAHTNFTGDTVLVDYSNYTISPKGTVGTLQCNVNATSEVQLFEVTGWVPPPAVMADIVECSVPDTAGEPTENCRAVCWGASHSFL